MHPSHHRAALALFTLPLVGCTAPKPDQYPGFKAEGGPQGAGQNEGNLADGAAAAKGGPQGAGQDAGDFAEAAADAEGADAADGQDESVLIPVPLAIAPSHLQLWLTADRGLTCVSGRVKSWADQSGHMADAALRSQQLGPQCQIPSNPHVVNGVDVPYFSAPLGPDGGLLNVVDETLDVDLGFLVNSNYTIFVVERRWADYPTGMEDYEFFLGTAVPASVEQQGPSAWCNSRPVNETLQFGYGYANSDITLGADQGSCTAGLSGTAASVPGSPPAPLSEDMLSFDNTRGHELWANGFRVAANADTSALSYSAGGSIGRASLVTTTFGYDIRFRGDIAEVLVYDTALDSPNRMAIETYLRAHWAF